MGCDASACELPARGEEGCEVVDPASRKAPFENADALMKKIGPRHPCAPSFPACDYRSAAAVIAMFASRARALFTRTFATSSGKGVRITQFGDWSSSLSQVELPAVAPAAGQVSVKFQAAPINPADLDVIAGTYGKLPTLPHFAGLEGVAVVDAVGAGAKLKVGQRVIPARSGFGTWRSHAVAEESAFLPVASDIPIEYSAVLSVNPCSAYVTEFLPTPSHVQFIFLTGTACSRILSLSKPVMSLFRMPQTAWSARLSSSSAN
jgi:hypothetical protein